MNISFDRLSLNSKIMSGFNGATIVTMGNIALPIKVGLVVQQVLFSIIEDLSPYNGIAGRAWLHAMKIVPLTYHQMISYLTSVGQIDLLSSQLVARQCYQLSVQVCEKNESSYKSGPRNPDLRIAITARRPSEGRRQGAISRRPPGINIPSRVG